MFTELSDVGDFVTVCILYSLKKTDRNRLLTDCQKLTANQDECRIRYFNFNQQSNHRRCHEIKQNGKICIE